MGDFSECVIVIVIPFPGNGHNGNDCRAVVWHTSSFRSCFYKKPDAVRLFVTRTVEVLKKQSCCPTVTTVASFLGVAGFLRASAPTTVCQERTL